MKIKLLVLGKIKERYIKEGCEEFAKRITPYCPFEVMEIKPEQVYDDSLIEKALDIEGDRILSLIKKDTYVITMEITGKHLSSEEFSSKLDELNKSGVGEVVFIIGSSHGISKKVSARSNYKLSLSKMTFLHEFARLILIEQIYRAFKISKKEAYHK